MEIYLREITGGAGFQFPVPPEDFEVSEPHQNQNLNINGIGEVTLPGKRSVRTISIKTILPNHDYDWLVCPRQSNPHWYIEWLKKKKEKGEKVRIIITGSGINMPCLIDELNYGESDASGDVNVMMTLKEYRFLTARPTRGKAKGVYITKAGDSLKKIAKLKLGSASKSKVLYKKNKKAIEKAFKKWKKKAGTKKVPWKNSKYGKHLAPGTKIYLR